MPPIVRKKRRLLAHSPYRHRLPNELLHELGACVRTKYLLVAWRKRKQLPGGALGVYLRKRQHTALNILKARMRSVELICGSKLSHVDYAEDTIVGLKRAAGEDIYESIQLDYIDKDGRKHKLDTEADYKKAFENGEVNQVRVRIAGFQPSPRKKQAPSVGVPVQQMYGAHPHYFGQWPQGGLPWGGMRAGNNSGAN